MMHAAITGLALIGWQTWAGSERHLCCHGTVASL